jgi:hypothetical protein
MQKKKRKKKKKMAMPYCEVRDCCFVTDEAEVE